MADEGGAAKAFSRREFLVGSGALGAMAFLAQVPELLKVRGWYDVAYAQDTDLVKDTFNGLVAFVLPGDDAYSVAQGEAADGPGAIAAGTTDALIANLDRFLPQPDAPGANNETVPLSGAVANLLNVVALRVNPVAAGGAFPSPFARLSFAEKAEVFRILEEEAPTPGGELPQPFTQASGNFAFLAGILPVLVAFLAGTEQAVFDDRTRSLSGRPVSWQISGYQPDGPVDGWDELKGFYQGRGRAEG